MGASPQLLPDFGPFPVREMMAAREMAEAERGAVVSRPLTLSAVLADERAVHVYRHLVAQELSHDWPERARGLLSCGEAGAVVFCRDCDRAHVVPYRCNARGCPTCAHLASVLVGEKLATRAEQALRVRRIDDLWEGVGRRQPKRWWLYTGTQWAEGARGSDERFRVKRLLAHIRRVRRAWGPFWRSVPWGRPIKSRRELVTFTAAGLPRRKRTTRARRDTIFAMGIEVAPGGMVHCHAAVYGEALPPKYLRTKWETYLGTRGRIDLREMSASTPEEFRKSLNEVLKYVSKGEEGHRKHARAASIELAMRGIRRVEMGGAIRRAADVTAADLVYEGAKSCMECGSQGRWRWAGLRAPSYVVENGGFGIDRWDDLRDASPANQKTLYRAYYGGVAPPWMNDDADDSPHVEAAYPSTH